VEVVEGSVIGKFGIQTLEQFFAMFGENLIQTGTL
jgi:hypothetical protein